MKVCYNNYRKYRASEGGCPRLWREFYVGKNDSKVERPRKELKAFEKIELQAGETKVVKLSIKKEELAYYDEGEKRFIIEEGEYQLYVGKSVAEICLEERFVIS